jgi:hypothetical protein
MKIIVKYLFYLSIFLFVISLTQKTFCLEPANCEDTLPGYFLIVIGILGVAFGGACLCWLANPFILIAWLSFKNIKISFFFSLLAVISSSSFLLFKEMIANEGGTYSEISHYHAGYWFWLSSIFIMLIANTIRLYLKKKEINNENGR